MRGGLIVLYFNYKGNGKRQQKPKGVKMSFEIGTQIFASSVQRGMVIGLTESLDDQFDNIDVEHISEGFDFWEFITGSGRKYTVNYGDRVVLLGWFNPEPLTP